MTAAYDAAADPRWDDADDGAAAERLRPLPLDAFLRLEIPPRDLHMTPWLPTAGLTMVYGPRGIGKTFLVDAVGFSVASGTPLLRFAVPQPRRVLLVDGEMSGAQLQERMARLVQAADADLDPDFLRVLAADLHRDGLPDLSTVGGQAALENVIDRAEVVIFDNLSTLVRSGVENEAEHWAPLQNWLLSLRRRGVTVILVHHAGRNGEARGTSKREDVLDTVIRLQRPDDYEAQQGCRFELHFAKHRGFYGDDAAPFEAMLTADANGRPVWTSRSIDARTGERVRELHGSGLTQREIASEVKMSLGKVNKLIRGADHAAVRNVFKRSRPRGMNT